MNTSKNPLVAARRVDGEPTSTVDAAPSHPRSPAPRRMAAATRRRGIASSRSALGPRPSPSQRANKARPAPGLNQ